SDQDLQFPRADIDTRLGKFYDQGIEVQIGPFRCVFERYLEIMGYLVVHNVVLPLQVFDGIIVDGLFFGILYIVKSIALIPDYHELLILKESPFASLSK